jgi:hypothetical protein
VGANLQFEFANGVRLRVVADGAWRNHVLAEYGPSQAFDDGPPDAIVSLSSALMPPRRSGSVADGAGLADRRTAADGSASDRHKSVGWRLRLGSPSDVPLRASILTWGWPAAIARSMAQGYVLEPIVSVAAARHNVVLVSAAGIATSDGLALLLGRSRAGKTTLAARFIVGGAQVLGDDQVFVDASGACWPFPRRLRLYPDFRTTTPEAFAALSRGDRASLRLRGIVARASRGYIRPSLPVAPRDLGAEWRPGPLAIARVLLLERDPAGSSISVTRGPASRATNAIRALLAAQRAKFTSLAGPTWAAAIAETAARERAVLDEAFGHLDVEVVSVPEAWGARRSIDAVAVLLHARSAAAERSG